MSTIVLLVVSLQTIMAGIISVYLTWILGMVLAQGPARSHVLLVAFLGGAVVGFVVWLPGLITSSFPVTNVRVLLASGVRLSGAIALSVLGFVVSMLASYIELRSGGNVVLVPLYLAGPFAPLVGAMVGYWFWQGRPG